LGANWANKHVSHIVHLHHPNQASSESLVHAVCNALWEEKDCVLCFICVVLYCTSSAVGEDDEFGPVFTLLNTLYRIIMYITACTVHFPI